MKIISRGTKPEDKIYQGTCAHCMTVFECKRHEGEYHPAMLQRGGGYLSVKCPVCGRPTNAYERSGGDLIPRDQRIGYWNPGFDDTGIYAPGSK